MKLSYLLLPSNCFHQTCISDSAIPKHSIQKIFKKSEISFRHKIRTFKMYIKIHKALNSNKSRPMYLFLIFLFTFQLFIVMQRYVSASQQVPENQKYSKITYIMLENTQVVTNTVLKEDYKMGRNLFQV